jgi:hypothetical protein
VLIMMLPRGIERKVASTLLGLFWSGAVAALGTDPSEQPLPSFDDVVSDTRRALVLEVLIENGAASLVDAYVSTTPPGTHVGDPAQLRIRWFDADGIRMGSRNSWDPRWQFEWDENGEERRILSSAVGAFDIIFSKDIATVAVTETATGLVLLETDVRNTILDYCLASPNDPNCEGVTNGPDDDGDGVINDEDNCPADPNPEQADADGDDIGDVCDPTPNGETVPGDLNGDDVADDEDYQLLRAALGSCEGHASFNPEADYTGDGCIDYIDLREWQILGEPPAPPVTQPAGC